MTHQFKVGDRVRLKDSSRDFAEMYGLTGVLTFAGIIGPHATFEGTRMIANPADVELVTPAPALIDPAKTYRTRGGRAVRIYATDGSSEYPIHGAIEDADKEGWKSEEWTATGAYYSDETEEFGGDLIEVKPEREGWVNVYRSGGGEHTSEVHPNKATAERYAEVMAGYIRIACIPVKFREGDGL